MPLEKLLIHLADTIKETKRISTRLRPPTLDELGLVSTCAIPCENFANSTRNFASANVWN